ncbi:restriction endonuclease subunit S [Streptomyces cyaneofuscatus]|uniref:restriction endonuclease subunit S n=1 Tax=Streptomyces cyaneofuscatus TaxID=66883 RepID=UPI00345D2480
MTSWSEVPFAELSASTRGAFSMGPFGSNITKENYTSSGVAVVRGVNLANGIFTDDGFVFISTEKADELASANVVPGDLVFTHRGTIGQVSMIPRNPRHSRYVIGSSQVKCRLDESKAIPEFYYYWFSSPLGQHSILAHTSTVGVPGIATPLSTIKRLRVPLPALEEQKSIAEILGALDDKIAANERNLATLNDFCSTWHERTFNRADFGTSAHTLAELVKSGLLTLGDGYRTKQSEHGEPGLPILRVADVGHGSITPSFTHYVSNTYRAAMGQKVSQPGDVVLTTKGTVGRVALIETDHPEFVYSPQVCYFRLTNDSPVSPLYLLHWFQGKEFWSQAGGLKGQTDMADYLSLRDIRSLRITVPSAADLTEFSRVCNPMQEQAEAKRRENRTLTTIRDTLLPQLVTGKIRIKDAERIVENAA